jgi:cytochrome b561
MAEWKNTHHEFGIIAKVLHWGMGLTIIGMLAFGFIMTSLPPGPQKWNFFYMIHKSVGVSLLGLLFLRLFWRWTNPTPVLTVTGWLAIIARLSVYVLYIMMLTMTLSGFIMSEAGNHPIQFFNLFEIPLILPFNRKLAFLASEIHSYSAFATVAIVCFHILAALYHHFILKDTVLKRMWVR